MILAYRALLALGRGDWSDADTFVERALSVAHRGRTDSHITSVLVFALAARLALHRQDMILARTQLGEAQRLRPLLSPAIPWYAVGSLLEMAEVSIGLGDPGAARQFTRDAEAVLRRRPDLGTLGKRMEELRGRRHRRSPLPVLAHGEVTGLADVPKFEVHTRSDAVARAREFGLLEA